MKNLRRHSDILFLGSIILGFVIGAVLLYTRWQVIEAIWDTNFTKYNVNPNDIIAGGTGRDKMIVPIDAPQFSSVAEAQGQFNDIDPVILLDHYGVVRAYPLMILAVHEVVNDTVGDVPIAVTFCPVCNSAVIYRREIDNQVLRMGVSGNFYGNNFLMYDHLTESWWLQFTGEAVVGDFTGERLDIVPSQQVVFRTYAQRYPNGEVLTGDRNHPNITYDASTYAAYQNGRTPPLDNGEYDPRLRPMERVLAISIANAQIAYPFHILAEVGVINHTVNGHDVVIFWQSGATSSYAMSNSQQDIGQAAAFGRQVDDLTLTFRSENGRFFDNETNSEWNIFGEAIAGELEGATLYDFQCFAYFWFAWSSAYPETEVYSP